MLRIVEHNFSVGVIVLFFEVLDVVSFQHAILIVPLLNLILFKERIYPLTPSQEGHKVHNFFDLFGYCCIYLSLILLSCVPPRKVICMEYCTNGESNLISSLSLPP
ncbi:hypothetical protein S83_032950 [Arachis hypogaea]